MLLPEINSIIFTQHPQNNNIGKAFCFLKNIITPHSLKLNEKRKEKCNKADLSPEGASGRKYSRSGFYA